MYHVRALDADERMINVHYFYYEDQQEEEEEECTLLCVISLR